MNFWGVRCLHCHRRLAIGSHGLCSRCNRLLARSAYCGHCGAILRENALSCGECLRSEPKWHRLVQIAPYKPPLNEWIYHFKYQDGYYWDQALARLLLLAVREARGNHGLSLPEVIMPVPLFWQRHWRRGYNQATQLAQHLARWLDIPLDCNSLQRVRATTPQQGLSAKQRHRNLKGAFVYRPRQPYRRVAIIDDVVTTGSTLNTISRELLKQGVTEIQVWCLAKTAYRIAAK